MQTAPSDEDFPLSGFSSGFKSVDPTWILIPLAQLASSSIPRAQVTIHNGAYLITNSSTSVDEEGFSEPERGKAYKAVLGSQV